MDRLEKIVLYCGVLFIIIILFTAIYNDEKGKESCESKGGVIVKSYSSQNCWKDGGYIRY